MTTAFGADVLIYAAVPGHPLGRKVAPLFDGDAEGGIGSLLLLTDVLAEPDARRPGLGRDGRSRRPTK